MQRMPLLAFLACTSIALSGCGRSHLGLDDSVGLRPEDSPDGAAVSSGNSGAAGGADPPRGGRSPNGSGEPPRSPTAGTDAPSTPGPGTGSVGSSVPPAPGSSDPDAPSDPDEPDADDILNPYRCGTEQPYVLTIDPNTGSGNVEGWLESAPSIRFDENNLPRFGKQGDPAQVEDGELGLWWSISELTDRERSLWFYPANSTTELVHLGLLTTNGIGDAAQLAYTNFSIGPVAVGEVAVFHHIPSDRYLAVQVHDLYPTDPAAQHGFCAAIDARWVFAARDTADFSHVW